MFEVSDKYLIKIIDMTKNFDKLGFKIKHGFFFFGSCGYNQYRKNPFFISY
jgi:hypothetical protein